MQEYGSEDWDLKISKRIPFVELEIYADEIILPRDFKSQKETLLELDVCLSLQLKEMI